MPCHTIHSTVYTLFVLEHTAPTIRSLEVVNLRRFYTTFVKLIGIQS